jgi:hypothetical protein
VNFSLELPSQKGLVTGDVAANLFPPSTNRGFGCLFQSVPSVQRRPLSHFVTTSRKRSERAPTATLPAPFISLVPPPRVYRLDFTLAWAILDSFRVRSLVHYSACYVRLRQLSNHPCPVASRLLSSASRTFNTATIRIEFEASS